MLLLHPTERHRDEVRQTVRVLLGHSMWSNIAPSSHLIKLLFRFQTPTTTRGDGCLSEMAELYWKCFCWVKSSGERLITAEWVRDTLFVTVKAGSSSEVHLRLIQTTYTGRERWSTLPNSRLLSYCTCCSEAGTSEFSGAIIPVLSLNTSPMHRFAFESSLLLQESLKLLILLIIIYKIGRLNIYIHING